MSGDRLAPDRQAEDAPVAPHPPLTRYYAYPEARAGYLRALFDRTAPAYDRINAVMSLGWGRHYRREMLAAAGLQPGMRLLDVATGTGLVAAEARRLLGGSGTVTGLDASPGMLTEARRTRAADLLVLGSADALPFANGTFDFVSMGYALRHVSDLNLAFSELRRVMAPGGTLLLLELTPPPHRAGRALLRLYLGRFLPLLSQFSTGNGDAGTLMRYYWDTIEACVPPQRILAAMGDSGLLRPRCDVQFGFLRAYVGHRA